MVLQNLTFYQYSSQALSYKHQKITAQMCLWNLRDALEQGAHEHCSDFKEEIVVSLGFTCPSRANYVEKMMPQ